MNIAEYKIIHTEDLFKYTVHNKIQNNEIYECSFNGGKTVDRSIYSPIMFFFFFFFFFFANQGFQI